MKNRYVLPGIALMLLVVLSGCLFPNDQKAQNKKPNEEQLKMVQHAVTQYREETNGLIPIKTKDNDVDYYQKYLIDFNILEEHQLLSEIPETAYENGGIYQYTIIDPEENPKVKVLDLRLSQLMREVHTKLNNYRSKNIYPPYGEQVADGVYKLNYEKLGYSEEPTAPSPYSKSRLPIVLDEAGEVYIDYRIDLQQAIDEYKTDFEQGEDIRKVLTDHYPFVPAYSLPYTLKDGEPKFQINDA